MSKENIYEDFIADMQEEARERWLGDDKTFRVTERVESEPRKRGPKEQKDLRTLPRQTVVLSGATLFDDNEYPAVVHTTRALADWIGGGEGIERIPHARLAELAGQLVQKEAARARRRKKIDVAT